MVDHRGPSHPFVVAVALLLVWLALVAGSIVAAPAVIGATWWVGALLALLGAASRACTVRLIDRALGGRWAPLPDWFVFSLGGVVTLCLLGATVLPAIWLVCGQA